MAETFEVSKLYSYVVVYDTGFAPNPFWGRCTLACCKPKIRLNVGKTYGTMNDIRNQNIWIVGITPSKVRNTGRQCLKYIMRVTECMDYEKYYQSYPDKIPDLTSEDYNKRCGDNIYPLNNGSIQIPSFHSKNETLKDTEGRFVLVSDQFVYFNAIQEPAIPPDLDELVVGIGHKANFSSNTIAAFKDLINHVFHSELIKLPHQRNNNYIPRDRQVGVDIVKGVQKGCGSY